MCNNRSILDNPFARLIAEGRISSPEQLKAAYHSLVMKTHPDAVGSDRLLEKYLQIGKHYEDARSTLLKQLKGSRDPEIAQPPNYRLEFYQQLHLVELLETPYVFHPEENQGRIRSAKGKGIEALLRWKPEAMELYLRADREYVSMKKEKPRGPYMKHALALNVRPMLYSITAYQLTGQEVYARQSMQNRSGIMHRLEEEGHGKLRELLEFLIEDMNKGAAVLD
jgi:hypothetical protein